MPAPVVLNGGSFARRNGIELYDNAYNTIFNFFNNASLQYNAQLLPRHNNNNNINNNTTEVRVPIVDIYAQTTVNADFLSDCTFIIQDKYKYKKPKNIVEECCKNGKGCACKKHYYPEKKLKTTNFYQVSPPLQDVVKGKGCTIREKLLNYYDKHQEIGPSFKDDFYEPMILYSLLKYILARLIYGDFNIGYLYRNYNDQFFEDLANSRFCGFIEFFNNPDNGIYDFDKYFICGKI